MFYRFRNGTFIEADTFEEAKRALIKRIEAEKENKAKWYKCSCLGFSHRRDCPENPINKGEVPY